MIEFLKGTVTPRDWMAVVGIVGLSAAIGAGFYFFVHQKQIEKTAQIEIADAQVMKDLDQARRYDAEIEKLRIKTEKIDALVKEFEERLPSRREIPILLKEFERMAAEEDIDVELTALPRSVDERKETIPYGIVARGNFHQIASFINRLERFKRYLKISDLSIGPSKKGRTTAKFTLNTYRFLQTTTGGA